MRVIIREAAYNDLDRIYEWIAQDGPRSADTVVARILESAERLGRFPTWAMWGESQGAMNGSYPARPIFSSTMFEKMRSSYWSMPSFTVRRIDPEKKPP